MTAKNLQELLDQTGDTVGLLRNSQLGTYIYPVVPSEFTNWRREQKAWQETAVLFDQSPPHGQPVHPRTGRAQADLATPASTAWPTSRWTWPSSSSRSRRPATSSATASSSASPRRSSSTSVVRPAPTGCSSRARPGLRRRDPQRPPVAVAAVRQARHPRPVALPDPGPQRLADHREAQRRHGRAAQVLPHGHHERSRGETVRTLRHGMAGAPGLEIWGPYESYDRIRDAILEAGREFGMEPVGSRAYSTNTLESGWIPSPLPADLHRRGAAAVPRVAAAPTATRRPTPSPAASSPTTSRTTTPTRGSSATARSSSSTTTSSAATPSRPSTRTPSAARSPWSGTPTTSPSCWPPRSRAPSTSSSTCPTPTTGRRTSTR